MNEYNFIYSFFHWIDVIQHYIFLKIFLYAPRRKIHGSAKEWSLGCVKRALAARGGQDAGITQPST